MKKLDNLYNELKEAFPELKWSSNLTERVKTVLQEAYEYGRDYGWQYAMDEWAQFQDEQDEREKRQLEAELSIRMGRMDDE